MARKIITIVSVLFFLGLEVTEAQVMKEPSDPMSELLDNNVNSHYFQLGHEATDKGELHISFIIQDRGRWGIQLINQDLEVVYHFSGYSKGEYELNLKTKKYKPGRYYLAVFSKDKVSTSEVNL